MPSSRHSAFGKPYSAFLFDMDGTIINSIASAERVWGKWAASHGLDVATFLPTMHGKRGIDTIRQLALPRVDPLKEVALIEQGEIDDVEGIVPIAGARDFLKTLPPERWAIVTSSPIRLAKARLAAAGMPMPRFIVTAEDVKVGKPHPDCYLLGAQRTGFPPSECLVFEDVAAGVLAGEAAGCDVMVITATHAHPLETPHTAIPGYEGIAAEIGDDGRMILVDGR